MQTFIFCSRKRDIVTQEFHHHFNIANSTLWIGRESHPGVCCKRQTYKLETAKIILEAEQ